MKKKKREPPDDDGFIYIYRGRIRTFWRVQIVLDPGGKRAWVRHHASGGNTQRHCHSALRKEHAPPSCPCRTADMKSRRLLNLIVNGSLRGEGKGTVIGRV